MQNRLGEVGQAALIPIWLFDEVIELAGREIGLIGVDRRCSDCWFLRKLYLLPAYQNRGIGGYLLERLIDDAKAAQVALRVTLLEESPARGLARARHRRRRGSADPMPFPRIPEGDIIL